MTIANYLARQNMPQNNALHSGSIELPVLHCEVCGHDWSPRKAALPKWCPNCGSRHWQTGRRRPPISEQRALAEKKREALLILNQESEVGVQEVISTVLPGAIILRLSEEEHDLLSKTAKQMGQSNVAHFVEDLTRIVIAKPAAETREFMIGDMLRKAKEAVEGKNKKTKAA